MDVTVVLIQVILFCLSSNTHVFAGIAIDSCDADGVVGADGVEERAPGRRGRDNATTNTAASLQVANDFKNFFEVGIREFDDSTDEEFATLSHVALWHKAISQLDIPDVDNESESSLSKMNRLLSSVLTKISDAAYPDPSSPQDPNHDWEGRAGRGFEGRKNRANHDSLNHMRTAAINLFYVHLVKRHRPDIWRRILKARDINPGTEDERLYLLNIFMAGYFVLLLRTDETDIGTHRYNMTEYGRQRLMKYFSPGGDPEGVAMNDSRQIPSVWLFQRLAQTDYYRSLLGKYTTHMTAALAQDNELGGTLTDENGNACIGYLFLQDTRGQHHLDTVADETLAWHFEKVATFGIGHVVDHVRINYSHFTRPKGCGVLWFRRMFETLFGPDHYMQRAKEIYSFWTYLTQQAGILSHEEEKGNNSVFTQMKSPNEIKLEMKKKFYTSNPWAKRLKRQWLYLAKYPPKNDDQKKFHALCHNFDAFFLSFFAKKHLRDNLDEETATFFEEVFWLSDEGRDDAS